MFNPPISEQAQQKLADLPTLDLLALKTKYSATFDQKKHVANNVGRVHELAEEQVASYAKIESQTQDKKMVAFAITFVVNRPYVTQVDSALFE